MEMMRTEQVIDEELDEKMKDLIIAYIIRYDDADKAVAKAGITKEQLREWMVENQDEEFAKRLYAFKKDCARTIIRNLSIPEPIAQWLENTKVEILPLLYNFDGLDDADELKAFIDEHNIYTGPWHFGMANVQDVNLITFRKELRELRGLIDKHLASVELSEPEKVRIRAAHSKRTVPTGFFESDGNTRWYKNAFNVGSINIVRAYADMWEVVRGRKQLKRCAAPECSKIFVQRKAGGRKQEYHSPVCARRVRQRKYKRRLKTKNNA